MPKKTLALISGLVLVTLVLFVVALKTSKQTQQQSQQPQVSPVVSQPSAAVVPAHTLLSLSPVDVNVASGQQGKVDVVIDTSDNAVTAVQIELQYDPKVIENVQVTSGSLFANPALLINKNDTKTGRVTYAFGILPNHDTVHGVGAVATVTFTAKGAVGTQSAITLLPESLVTARGVAESVRKNGADPVHATVMIGSGTGGAVVPNAMTPTNAVDSMH